MRIAIVPARGGSKRIPNKNIALVAGRPLLAWTLDAITASEVFDTVHVSTDSPAIADVAAACGHPVPFLRDPALADDTTPLRPVLRWVLERLAEGGGDPDVVAFVAPTAALLEPSDLRVAVERFVQLDATRPVLGVAPYPAPTEWAFDLRDDGVLDPVEPATHASRSQDLRAHWYDAGLFSIWSPALLRSDEPPPPVGHPLPPHRAVDVDVSEDLHLLEVLLVGSRRLGER